MAKRERVKWRFPMRAPMAKPREVRGWVLYGTAVATAFLMLGFRLFYSTSGAISPSFLFEWIDVPFVLAVLAGALAALGLHQALWYRLVTRQGVPLFASSFLMFVVAALLFYGLPAHLGVVTFFYLMFAAAVVLFAYTPTLSYGSKVYTGIAVVGAGALLASSLYGPFTGQAPLWNPVILGTLVAEALLLLGTLRLLQFAVRTMPVAASA